MVEITGMSTLSQAKVHQQSQALNEKELESAKEFEAVFLSQFVDEMMKTVDVGVSTGGKDGEMWRSFMSDALSQGLVDRGGLGLAANIGQVISAYKRP